MLTSREKFITLVDNDSIRFSDAIILLEGDGLNRYPYAVSLFKKGLASTFVFSGGVNHYGYGSYPFSDVFPLLLKEGIPESAIIHESRSLNTREQAIEIMKICQQKHWHKIILVGSHYHQYRAYLTFLKAMKEFNLELVIYNAPAQHLEWFSANDWGSRYDLLMDEFSKIENYTRFGHLVTFDEAIEYQQWKEVQK